MDVPVAPDEKPLLQNERCDVVVVGAGIAGISTAYELACRKLSVIVVDRGSIAGGMTARTTVHLAPLCDDLMSEMTKLRGLDASKIFYESHAASVDRIEEIQKSENIDCDFRRLDGYLFQGNGMPSDVIDTELRSVAPWSAPVAPAPTYYKPAPGRKMDRLFKPPTNPFCRSLFRIKELHRCNSTVGRRNP